ncbi:hypothetical protein B0H66DRAFT_639403 [Apodospora peruviana]|uniref:Uncharacterized protein n=1 Tax=Apodospora peruviana TaxID=516989 RepID=A0AAE0M419_9PEZI|nr:hypothetical protein B0H66DRAFT_639403 [Apodospora peruviana]
MVNFAMPSAAALALASFTAAQFQISCSTSFASRCGSEWVRLGTPSNIRQLQDLVRETTGREPTADQARNMVFTCTLARVLEFTRACQAGQCIRGAGDGVDTCSGNELPWP